MIDESQPLNGSTMALETRYDVKIQVLSSVPADKLPAMWGRATLAMLVSSTSMKVASVTVRAIIQGLIAGRHSAVWFIVVVAAPMFFRVLGYELLASVSSFGFGCRAFARRGRT